MSFWENCIAKTAQKAGEDEYSQCFYHVEWYSSSNGGINTLQAGVIDFEADTAKMLSPHTKQQHTEPFTHLLISRRLFHFSKSLLNKSTQNHQTMFHCISLVPHIAFIISVIY